MVLYAREDLPYVQTPLFTLLILVNSCKKWYLPRKKKAKQLANQYKLTFGKTAPSTFSPDVQFPLNKDNILFRYFIIVVNLQGINTFPECILNYFNNWLPKGGCFN